MAIFQVFWKCPCFTGQFSKNRESCRVPGSSQSIPNLVLNLVLTGVQLYWYQYRYWWWKIDNRVLGFRFFSSFLPIKNGHFSGILKMCMFHWSVFKKSRKCSARGFLITHTKFSTKFSTYLLVGTGVRYSP